MFVMKTIVMLQQYTFQDLFKISCSISLYYNIGWLLFYNVIVRDYQMRWKTYKTFLKKEKKNIFAIFNF